MSKKFGSQLENRDSVENRDSWLPLVSIFKPTIIRKNILWMGLVELDLGWIQNGGAVWNGGRGEGSGKAKEIWNKIWGALLFLQAFRSKKKLTLKEQFSLVIRAHFLWLTFKRL